jgi:hypothetical protein
MSEPAVPARRSWDRLPARLRPLERELVGAGEMRLIETALLILVGLILATATIADDVRNVGINKRLIADLSTWRGYTRHDYHNVGVEQQLFGISSTRDVACGNIKGGPPDSYPQICLLIAGPIRHGKRQVLGGWYVPAYVQHNDYQYRYGCFGSATKGLCAR